MLTIPAPETPPDPVVETPSVPSKTPLLTSPSSTTPKTLPTLTEQPQLDSPSSTVPKHGDAPARPLQTDSPKSGTPKPSPTKTTPTKPDTPTDAMSGRWSVALVCGVDADPSTYLSAFACDVQKEIDMSALARAFELEVREKKEGAGDKGKKKGREVEGLVNGKTGGDGVVVSVRAFEGFVGEGGNAVGFDVVLLDVRDLVEGSVAASQILKSCNGLIVFGELDAEADFASLLELLLKLNIPIRIINTIANVRASTTSGVPSNAKSVANAFGCAVYEGPANLDEGIETKESDGKPDGTEHTGANVHVQGLKSYFGDLLSDMVVTGEKKKVRIAMLSRISPYLKQSLLIQQAQDLLSANHNDVHTSLASITIDNERICILINALLHLTSTRADGDEVRSSVLTLANGHESLCGLVGEVVDCVEKVWDGLGLGNAAKQLRGVWLLLGSILGEGMDGADVVFNKVFVSTLNSIAQLLEMVGSVIQRALDTRDMDRKTPEQLMGPKVTTPEVVWPEELKAIRGVIVGLSIGRVCRMGYLEGPDRAFNTEEGSLDRFKWSELGTDARILEDLVEVIRNLRERVVVKVREEVGGIVLSLPSFITALALETALSAVEAAGLHVIKVVDEVTAAHRILDKAEAND
ncbi:hypothetical protein HK097_009500 [Rhizophlyctis rosea]|uniref:Uncharacterized protein n=1 Tax=Rhizophlyctis rosea TaxID=64517 RepID=A0AAD5X0E1_9FUNG|nr:hypothetical protein HK097_009500 [Rhizophlyctis rosea]